MYAFSIACKCYISPMQIWREKSQLTELSVVGSILVNVLYLYYIKVKLKPLLILLTGFPKVRWQTRVQLTLIQEFNFLLPITQAREDGHRLAQITTQWRSEIWPRVSVVLRILSGNNHFWQLMRVLVWDYLPLTPKVRMQRNKILVVE